uniref:Uncharacterized protein n=1 Tax=Anguilla anguilla TaxID=7936 RepID=A0A0E9PHN4_ANGAN
MFEFVKKKIYSNIFKVTPDSMTFKLLFQSFLFYQNNFQHDIKKKKVQSTS